MTFPHVRLAGERRPILRSPIPGRYDRWCATQCPTCDHLSGALSTQGRRTEGSVDAARSLIIAVLPLKDARTQVLLGLLCRDHGRPASALAREAGFNSRFVLYRALRSAGLPPLTELRQWIRVLSWTFEVEQHGRSLAATALATEQDPAAYYRVIRRLTGVPWSLVKARGFGWLLYRFLDRVYGELSMQTTGERQAGRQAGIKRAA